jgi:hypothetical protein
LRELKRRDARGEDYGHAEFIKDLRSGKIQPRAGDSSFPMYGDQSLLGAKKRRRGTIKWTLRNYGGEGRKKRRRGTIKWTTEQGTISWTTTEVENAGNRGEDV